MPSCLLAKKSLTCGGLGGAGCCATGTSSHLRNMSCLCYFVHLGHLVPGRNNNIGPMILEDRVRGMQKGGGKVFLDVGCVWESVPEERVSKQNIDHVIGSVAGDRETEWLLANITQNIHDEGGGIHSSRLGC